MQETQTAANRLADRTAAAVTALWARGLPVNQFRDRASEVVARANAAGVQLADLGLSAEITRQLGHLTRPLGLRPTVVQTDTARIGRDIDRILSETPADATTHELVEASRRARFERLGKSELLLTVATTIQQGMQRRGAQGWTRGLSGTSCPQCNGWADGATRPTTVSMARHVGCDCIQIPVFT